MNGSSGAVVWKAIRLKRRANVPRSAVLLLCLFVLALGGCNALASVLDEGTALRVNLVFLADLNGDEHQDAFLVTNQIHRLTFNDGAGNFTSSEESFMRNYALALGDLDGNESLDAILVNFEHGEIGGELITECAEAPAAFVLPERSNDLPGQVFAMGDGNRDGVPESYITGCCGGGTSMINYGTLFSNRRTCLGTKHPAAAALGDLNGDQTLDVFLANGWMFVDGQPQSRTPNEVWFNDGLGNFTDSGQRLGDNQSFAVMLGDLNGDSFLDAVVGNHNGGEIWVNDGHGSFTIKNERLGRGMTNTIFVTDLDKDGDLDLFLGGNSSIRVWQNDGIGRFKSGQRITFGYLEAVAVGDVTSDGFVDIFVGGPDSYRVWRGDGNGRFDAGAMAAYR